MKKNQRGAANLHLFNSEREAQNIPRIQEELKKARRLKLEFKSLGKLANYISEMTSIHRTTLTRNLHYRVLLVDHLASVKGYLETIPDDKASPEVLQAKLLALRLETSNLRQYVKRLELLSASSCGTPPRPEELNQTLLSNQDYLAFIDTAMALTAVLERMKDTILINVNHRTIEDLAAPHSKRIIAGPERVTAYINWLRKEEEILLKFNENNKNNKNNDTHQKDI